MKLREYQEESLQAVLREWESVVSTLVVLPTGAGKTILFASVIHKLQPKRAMVVAAREELIFQARDKIGKVSGLNCCIEMGELSAKHSLLNRSQVVCATVQTLNSALGDRTRMSRFNPKDFGMLIIDEAHHATAQTYRNVINYFTTNNPELRVLGVTATPDRTDESALGQVFESVAYNYEILEAIHDGFLVPVEQQMVYIDGLDISGVRTTAGDLNGADMREVMEAERNLQGVAGASIQIIGNRRTIVFTSSVKQADVICQIFNRHKSECAEMVCGSTPKEERRKILERFESGKTQIVCNCDVLTEGFDNPGVEVVVMAKLTKSRSKYAQMCGRSMRPLTGVIDHATNADERKQAIFDSPKPSCLVIDFMGNSGRHKLMTAADILGGNVSEEAVQRVKERAKNSSEPVNITQAMEEEEAKLQEEIKRRMIEDAARKARMVARVEYTKRKIDPFDALDIHLHEERGWDSGKTLSEKQANLLLKQGIDPYSMPYAAAKQLLNEMFRRWNNQLCTMKQAALIKKHIPDANTKEMTMHEARLVIDSIAHNGWKAPEEVKSKYKREPLPF